jgi:hypothetical protein
MISRELGFVGYFDQKLGPRKFNDRAPQSVEQVPSLAYFRALRIFRVFFACLAAALAAPR